MSPSEPDPESTAPPNTYCKAIRIEPFRLELVPVPKGLKLFHWMVLAILERGRPITIEELVDRLQQIGVLLPDEDGPYALSKAWHGLPPVYKTPDGRYGLITQGVELWALAHEAGLTRDRTDPEPEQPDVIVRMDHDPLIEEELEVAFRDADLTRVLSPMRQAAAVLDVVGHALTVAEIDQRLATLTPHRRPLQETGLGRSQSKMISVAPDGRLQLNRADWDVKAMRQAVRQRALPRLRERARKARWEQHYSRSRKDVALRQQKAKEEAASFRRVVIRVVPQPTKIQAAALLDVKARSLRTFVGEELSEISGVLQGYDLIAGLQVRDTLVTLGIDPDRFRIADLQPPKKTKQLNRSGRKLTITPEMIISYSCGISRPLGDPKKVAEYLRTGNRPKLAARLESDVKALFALYNYGLLHRSVRLRWGFLDEHLGIEWALEGDPSLYEILETACKEGKPVDVVVGSAPGWSDPWSRAQRLEIVEVGFHEAVVRQHGQVLVLARDEVQAARIAD